MDSAGFSLNSADNKGILSLLSAIEQTGDNFETDPESPEPIKDHIEGHETAFNQLEGKELMSTVDYVQPSCSISRTGYRSVAQQI